MGNSGSTASSHRRRQSSRRHQTPPPPPPPLPPPPHPNMVFAAATPYPAPYYHQQHGPPPTAGYYHPPPPPPPQIPLPYNPHQHQHQHQHHHVPGWGPYPHCPAPVPPPRPYVEHQKAVTIRNDVNLKKESLKVVPDEDHPGKFLVSFTFDATVPASITVIFFAKEGEDCKLTSTKENILPPVTVNFEQGLGQTFKQPSGTGIDFAMFEESELLKEGGVDVFPLAVKADACPDIQTDSDGNTVPGTMNTQITQAVFEKDKGEYKVKVLKQILWVNGVRYELQEIYGIGNSVEDDFDGNDPGKECVICLSEPRDTTVLPCRHMCMCSGCAKVLRFQTNRCPICRQPVERLLEIKVSNGDEEESNN